MSNWYDKTNDKEIQALKDNRTAYNLLCIENPALADSLQKIEDHLQYFNAFEGVWRPATNIGTTHSLTFRLDPNWTRPKEEDKMSESEERYVITEKGKERLRAMNKTPQMVRCTAWGNRNSTGCYIIEKNGHELFLTEYEAQTIADQINNHIMEGEMAADAYKEAEERPF